MFDRKAVVKYCMLIVSIASYAAPASAATVIPHSWNGWRWSDDAALSLKIGNNVSADWNKYLTAGASSWSKNANINLRLTSGGTSASACGMVYGTVQACSADYGATGWLGYASVLTLGSTIVAATVKLNDFYFKQARYDTSAFRSMIACQELGHTIGLAHVDTNNTNTNVGTCMDYSNDPSGRQGTNGTSSNTKPNAADMAALDQIYASDTLPSSLLKETGDGYYIDADHDHDHDHVSAVPEASTWMTMIMGLCAIGGMLRRPRLRPRSSEHRDGQRGLSAGPYLV